MAQSGSVLRGGRGRKPGAVPRGEPAPGQTHRAGRRGRPQRPAVPPRARHAALVGDGPVGADTRDGRRRIPLLPAPERQHREGRSAAAATPRRRRSAPNAAGQTPLNILLIGSDSRASDENVELGGARKDRGNPPLADVQMLIHLAADRKSASVVSIPRDTRVDIPECTDPESGRELPAGQHDHQHLAGPRRSGLHAGDLGEPHRDLHRPLDDDRLRGRGEYGGRHRRGRGVRGAERVGPPAARRARRLRPEAEGRPDEGPGRAGFAVAAHPPRLGQRPAAGQGAAHVHELDDPHAQAAERLHRHRPADGPGRGGHQIADTCRRRSARSRSCTTSGRS